MDWLKLTRLPGRFARLDRPRRILLLQAAALLWKHRLRLWLRPFRMPEVPEAPSSPASSSAPSAPPSPSSPSSPAPSAAAGSSAASASSAPEPSHPSPGLIGWAVTAASRVVPRSTCLVRALAAQALCRRHGLPSRLQLGARRGDAGDLEAHAWLEMGDEVIIGGGDALDQYTPFAPARNRKKDPTGS